MAPISTAETVAAQAKPAGVMLTRGIADAYRNGRGKLAELPGVREIGAGEAAQTDCQPAARCTKSARRRSWPSRRSATRCSGRRR